MKTKYLPLLLLIALGFSTGQVNGQVIAMSAEEIWQNVIDHYDPDGKWDSYRGEMHMYVISDNNRPGREDLIIDNSKNLYQSVRFVNDSVLIQGILNEEVYLKINDNAYRPSEVPDHLAKRLNENRARVFREHHFMHFSLPLFLHGMGASPNPHVDLDAFEGDDVYVIEFDALKNVYKQGFFNGPVKLYVNTSDFRLTKAYWDIDFAGGTTVVTRQEMELNGIKVQQIRTFFNGKGKYFHTDIFYPYTKLEYDENGEFNLALIKE